MNLTQLKSEKDKVMKGCGKTFEGFHLLHICGEEELYYGKVNGHRLCPTCQAVSKAYDDGIQAVENTIKENMLNQISLEHDAFNRGKSEQIKEEIEFLGKIHNYCLGTYATVGRSILDDFDKLIKNRLSQLQKQTGETK